LTSKTRSLTRRGRRCWQDHYILHSEEEKAIKKMGNKKATDDDNVPGGCTQTVGRKWSHTNDTTGHHHMKLVSGQRISLHS